jgi:hypothetical protein
MGSFCKIEVILDDFDGPENFGVPKIRGIQKKRYNEEIFLCVSGPD